MANSNEASVSMERVDKDHLDIIKSFPCGTKVSITLTVEQARFIAECILTDGGASGKSNT